MIGSDIACQSSSPMNAANISLLNAILLIALGSAGYFFSDKPSLTALIPAVFGALLLACQPGVRKHDKVVAHVAVLLTLVLLIALVMPLRSAVGQSDSAAIGRVTIMLLSTAFALVMFIKSFIDGKKQRQLESQTAGQTEANDG